MRRRWSSFITVAINGIEPGTSWLRVLGPIPWAMSTATLLCFKSTLFQDVIGAWDGMGGGGGATVHTPSPEKERVEGNKIIRTKFGRIRAEFWQIWGRIPARLFFFCLSTYSESPSRYWNRRTDLFGLCHETRNDCNAVHKIRSNVLCWFRLNCVTWD